MAEHQDNSIDWMRVLFLYGAFMMVASLTLLAILGIVYGVWYALGGNPNDQTFIGLTITMCGLFVTGVIAFIISQLAE